METKLNKLVGMQDSPIGPVETVSMDVWRVDVYADELPNGMLHVGTIGRHDGANFCAAHSYDSFTPEQKDEILAAVRSQHGSASTAAPVELPEDIVYQEEDDDEAVEVDDDDLEDTEDTEIE